MNRTQKSWYVLTVDDNDRIDFIRQAFPDSCLTAYIPEKGPSKCDGIFSHEDLDALMSNYDVFSASQVSFRRRACEKHI